MNAGALLRLDALPGGERPEFVAALAAFVCAWPSEFLDLVRDPERLAVVCRAVREASGVQPAQARRSAT